MTLVCSPLGWVSLAAFSFPPGLAFAMGALAPGTPVSMRLPLQVAAWCLFITAPVLALRSVTEERRAGTWDSLVASPASASAIVLGKLAAMSMFMLLFALPLVAQFGLLSLVARPDAGEFLCGLLGVLLAGVAILASAMVFALIVPTGTAAFLLTIGFWSAWLLVSRALPTIVSPGWVTAAFAIDPLRRVDDFLLGMLDPANAVFFLSIIGVSAVVAIETVADPRRTGSSARRALPRAAMLLATIVAAIAAVGLSSQPELRRSIDLTRTRAWTLSDRTSSLIASLEGDWRIEALAGRDTIDATALRQIDEVLAQLNGLRTRSGVVTALRIDPADPSQVESFDAALERLERMHAAPLREVHAAVEAGIESYERLVAWAGAEANAIVALLAQTASAGESAPSDSSRSASRPLTDDERVVLDQWRSIAARLAADHRAFLDAVRAEARSSERSPLGDPRRAASMLETALRAWIRQCNDAEAALRELRRRERMPEAAAEYLRDAPRRAADMAQQLSVTQDRLARLPELALGEVAAALRAGDAVIVSGPDRIAAIPGWQVLPQAGSDPSSFDRRFRGEEVIASAVRSLERGRAPEVIVVHGEGRSLLRPSADRMDLAALVDALRAVRCSVREWQPATEPPPSAAEGRTPVWLVIPPLRRAGVEPDPRERRLLDAAARLVGRGEPVLLVVTPSLLPLIGQKDPWAEVAALAGVEARTGRTLLELAATSERQREVRAYFELTPADAHASSRGAVGLRTLMSEPVPLEAIERRSIESEGAGAEDGAIGGAGGPRAGDTARFASVVEVAPAVNRWIEDDWRSAVRRTIEVPAAKRFDRPVTIIAATEHSGGRRAVVSGGAAWLLSGLADMTGQIGPDRVFLRYPGNRELAVGLVGWLAGLEDSLGSGSGREVERIPVLAPWSHGAVAVTAAAGVPMAALVIGLVVRIRRRSA